uniref:Xylanolytic transcriptional activator regulatory domain-containing protein n=1 Tax=Bionectria ochroleuca TaxID=29856 RepID=A0A0B7KI12_BIOOC
MVLTLGYIAANDDSQPGHGIYFARASKHLGMSCFASGHIYTLQALALYSGYYLHYLNRPNMASAIMGAAHRMAVAMGLHQVTPSLKASSSPGSNVDARAGTWWSLFCLDVWAGTTLGRPIGGMWDVESMASSSMHLGANLDYQSISIRTSASFCRIAARIQDRMARLPLLLPNELKQFNQELLAWHADIHPIFRDPKHSPEPIRLASLILQYRYLDQRMTLYRPYLLLRSLGASSRSEHSPRNDTAAIADTCVTIARETIELIKANWYPNQLVAWNSSWFLFQAVLVVLLGLSSATPETDVQPLEREIEESLRLFNEMCRWRGPAAHTHDLIQFIYESRALEEHDLGVEELLSDEALMILLGFEPNSELAWAGLFDGEQGSSESGMFGFGL